MRAAVKKRNPTLQSPAPRTVHHRAESLFTIAGIRTLYSCIALHIAYNVWIALSELLAVTFPDSWYRGYDLFRAEAWWLHATILAVSTALAIDYLRSDRRRGNQTAHILG